MTLQIKTIECPSFKKIYIYITIKKLKDVNGSSLGLNLVPPGPYWTRM